MTSLLANFELDAELNLIFLRSVERVEIYERARGSADPVLRYRVQVRPPRVMYTIPRDPEMPGFRRPYHGIFGD